MTTLIDHITNTIANIDGNTLSTARSAKLALLVLATYAPAKTRLHSEYDGYVSHHYTFIAKAAGGIYKNKKISTGSLAAINHDLDLFVIAGAYSKKQSLTKGYKLSSWLTASINNYLFDTYINVGYTDNEKCSLLKKAITKFDKNDKQRKGKGNLKFAVQINRKVLFELVKKISTLGTDGQLITSNDKNALIAKQALVMLENSNGKVLPRGWMAQPYIEVASGRVYGTGLHLQNACKETRTAALKGLYQLDISNAHYSILAQASAANNTPLQNIEFYIRNKQMVRATIAEDCMMELKDVKQALIALIYGASLSTKYLRTDKGVKQTAIFRICGSDEAYDALIQHHFFKGIAEDVKKGGSVMIDNAKAKTGNMYNALNKPISSSETLAKQTAHLLQGIEAQALDAVLTAAEVAVALHDGYVFYTKVSASFLENEIKKATGYNLTLEEETI